MYAFGVMTWEVRIHSFVGYCSIRLFDTDSHGSTTVLGNDRNCGSVLDAERGQATATEPPGNLGSNVASYRAMLGCRALETRVGWGGNQNPGSRN